MLLSGKDWTWYCTSQGVGGNHGARVCEGKANEERDRAVVVEVLGGSDYPHQIGSLDKMVSSIDQLDTVDDEKEGCWAAMSCACSDCEAPSAGGTAKLARTSRSNSQQWRREKTCQKTHSTT